MGAATMMLYNTLGTNDLARATRFYDPTLATLGVVRLKQSPGEIGYGQPGSADCQFWITKPFDKKPASIGNGAMCALVAATRAAVDAFHAAGLANGGTDEGKPGLRYAPTFYSCYLRDPDGNKLSAVCVAAE